MQSALPSDAELSDAEVAHSIAHNKSSSPRRTFAGYALAHWLRHEPMVHFIALGALIFLASHAIEQARATAGNTIVIDAALTRRLSKLYELQLGAAPSTAQLAQLTDSYVHDEVLYREALALGLDKGDEIVRRRLVQKMGFLQNDLAIVAEPDEQTLRRHYELHATQFAEPARVSFHQLFFSTDGGDTDATYRRATAARIRLNAGAAASDFGDRSALAAQYQRLDERELQRLFGATPIVEQLLSTQTPESASNGWSGPVRSGYGWHLIKVDEHIDRRALSFDAARAQLVDAIKAQRKEDNNERGYRQLLAHYQVRNSVEPTPP